MRSRVASCLRSGLGLSLTLATTACQTDYENPFTAPASAPLPDSATLLFVSNSYDPTRTAPRELFAVDDRGGAPVRLTSCTTRVPACEIVEVAPAPDRARVALRRRADSDRDTVVEPDEDDGIYVIDLGRGIEGRTILPNQITSIDWSPQDELVVYSAQGEGGLEDLYSAFANGSDPGNRTATPDVRERRFRFDATGRTLAYERSQPGQRSEVWLYRSLLVQARVTDNSAVELPPTVLPGTHYIIGSDTDPDFAPDGSAVVFRRLTGLGESGRGAWELMLGTGTTGSDVRSLTPGAPAWRSAPDWGPRGIAFIEIPVGSTTASLVVLDATLNGTRRIVLSQAASFAFDSPRWLP